MYVHTDGTDAPFLSIFYGCKKCGCFRSVINRDTETFQFFIKRRFERRTPDTQRKTVLIIISKHQLRLIIPEFRTLKLIFRITDLATETFQIQHTVIPFSALNIMCDTVAVMILLIHISIGNFFRCHLRTRIGTG